MAINKFSVTIGNSEFTFDPDDSWSNPENGKVFYFNSIRKVKNFKPKKGDYVRRQVLTWNKDDDEDFKQFLRRVIGDEDW